MPKKWIQIEDLPKTASNKIKRKTLREYLER
jgi:acyl-coenzyme A synthetase/AMP-(fatty) acid ligase